MAPGDVIELHDLLIPSREKQGTPGETSRSGDGKNNILPIEELEKRHIETTLKHFNGNRTKTAQTLHISTKTLYLKIKRYGIRVD